MGLAFLVACADGRDASWEERLQVRELQQDMIDLQPFPVDIIASQYRHNLRRRQYFLNGMPEKAASLVNPVPNPPLGYVVLFLEGVGAVGRFMVDGKVTSLAYSLVPYSEYWERGFSGGGYRGNGESVVPTGNNRNRWLANAGGVYGTNHDGIFWFTPCGHYMEWFGPYLFTSVPFIIDDPILRIENVERVVVQNAE